MEAEVVKEKKNNIIRRMYDWVLHWADTKWGVLALFILAFAESSFFPIPPDVLLIACCLGIPTKSFKYALVCTIGSVMGAIAGYGLGTFLWDGAIADFFFNHVPGFTQNVYDSVQVMYEEYNFGVVFTAGFTPIPYKVITITAGVFKIDFIVFLIASIISRGARFFLIGWMIWKFGQPIKSFIDKYFNLLAIGFTVLLVGGFIAIKYLF